MSINRVYVEKKRGGFAVEADHLRADLISFLRDQHPDINDLAEIRILRRYDVEGLNEEQFKRAVVSIFSEPQCDVVFEGNVPAGKNEQYFGAAYLAGQYDQRSDSAEQCAELIFGVRPIVKTALVYSMRMKNAGSTRLSDETLAAIKKYIINPVDSEETSCDMPVSLQAPVIPVKEVPVLRGFSDMAGDKLNRHAYVARLAKQHSLAMSLDDTLFCANYFSSLQRDPTLAELKVLDTYWSDHCRHTTFTTELEGFFDFFENSPLAQTNIKRAVDLYKKARLEVYGEDPPAQGAARPPTLMDIATIGAKTLKKRGLACDVDESPEINACAIKAQAEFDDGGTEPYLLLFKNETHNHPTEIEPFGGAATCLGGAIRDPLSGRAFVHQAMRIAGSGDPRSNKTAPGKLPQIKIARESAAGYSSYGNQIGLATGQVAEFYHPGYAAKHLELGAVIAAAPEAWIRREYPASGDAVILVGGKTGRDGIGGATGSSKAHTRESVETSGAEVQKGNPVEERKIQRLFRNPAVTTLIKRCNDFGAGGVSVAVGELAEGVDINLDAMPKKYAGLDGVELAISESQERMAVVVDARDVDAFIAASAAENLDAVVIATITDKRRLRMFWQGKLIVDLPRDFLNSNGARRSISLSAISAPAISVDEEQKPPARPQTEEKKSPVVMLDNLERELASLRSGSRRGLQERFDGSIGAGSVLFPFGGAEQGTSECGMAALLPALGKESRSASLMAFGFDPDAMVADAAEGAKGAVREALAKCACMGGDPWKMRLSLQEYFERPDTLAAWLKPISALLGALEAQLELDVPAIGGKDSMSGSYDDEEHNIHLAVPPTLVAFAAGIAPAAKVRSGALSGKSGNALLLLRQDASRCEWEVFKANMNALMRLGEASLVYAAYPVGAGGVAASLAVMSFGNMQGVEVDADALEEAEADSAFGWRGRQGSVLLEIEDIETAKTLLDAKGSPAPSYRVIGATIADKVFRVSNANSANGKAANGVGPQELPEMFPAEAPLEELRRAYEYPLADIYPQTSHGATVAEKGSGGNGECFAPANLWNEGERRTSLFQNQTGSGTDLKESGQKPAFPFKSGVSAPKTEVLEQPHIESPLSSQRPAFFVAKGASPLVLLPVFPGTNCEWDMERSFRKAGARVKLVIFRNITREAVADSIAELASALDEAQILALSGGFRAGDEPDGSGKFIANVFRAPRVMDAMDRLLDRDSLTLGICNGFQALIKLGLVPDGRIRDRTGDSPTLTFNDIGRHVSRMVRTRVMPSNSPWLALEREGAIHVVPVSHGEGKFVASDEEGRRLLRNGQVAFCYVDAGGNPALTEPDNPNGSHFAIEGVTSPDGRILGKMGHSERAGDYAHINIPANKQQRIFEAGVRYFR
ncbi:MAG: phosphoribosylformylglycinamidine synthase subunit PurQ [Treponema sp.]|jgi:phosphoribosylformylglycinamidine synthase|nr:phosphoribosylformylglycinamidine synthase subunit PurQ [Treponema sp.]